jgi:sigma-B regulation protein RsbU (phosphoserine phosphatase)
LETLTAGFLAFLVVAGTLLALFYSRTITRRLEALATASKKLARGDFEARVDTRSRDEFGEMSRVFNSIGPQLKEHYKVQHSLDVAKEIQRNLLPLTAPNMPGLDIYGTIRYCEATGGDYFDYLDVDGTDQENLCVVVGDVADHGIPSALLMTTARAFLRLRSSMPGELRRIIFDINREFAKDVETSGQFMTLFLARVDRKKETIEWVRAGHEPAMIYDSRTGSFTELTGEGVALGVLGDWEHDTSTASIRPGQIIYIGTDGIPESRNSNGESYGRKRLYQTIQKHAAEPAKKIVDAILKDIERYRGGFEQEDDITLVIIKVTDR